MLHGVHQTRNSKVHAVCDKGGHNVEKQANPMDQDRLNLLRHKRSVLGLIVNHRPPALGAIAAAGVGTIKCDGLECVVVLGPLCVVDVELAQLHDVLSVCCSGLANVFPALASRLGVRSLCLQIVAN
jgi:hypothetical protein